MASIEFHLSPEDSQQIRSDMIPFEGSSVMQQSEVSDQNMKYNKRPAIYNKVSTKRFSGPIDLRKRKTLTTQVQLSRTKLETIKETSHFESRISMAEVDNTNNMELVSSSMAPSSTKASKASVELIKYQKAITQKVTQWSLIAILILYLLMLVYLIASRFLLESIFQTSKDKSKSLSLFYESLSLQRLYFNTAYFTILRSVAFNDGSLTDSRFEKNRAKFDSLKNFVKTQEFQLMGSYQSYLKNQLHVEFTSTIAATMDLSNKLFNDPKSRDYLLNTIAPISQPNWKGTFDIEGFEIYRSALGPYLYHPLYDILQEDVGFFSRSLNKTMPYSVVMHNYLYSYYDSVDNLFALSRVNFTKSFDRFYFGSIVITLSLVAIGAAALICTWIFSFMDLRSFQRTTTSIFSCSKEDLEHRKSLLARLTTVLTNHRNDNYFYIGNLRAKDLEAGNEDYPKNVRMALFGQKKFDWLGTLTSLMMITLFYLMVIAIGVANTVQYMADTSMMNRYVSRLELVTKIPLQQTLHLNQVVNYLLFGGSISKAIGRADNFSKVSALIKREEDDIIDQVVTISQGDYVYKRTLDDFYTNLLLGDICTKTFGTDPKTEACLILDKGVASKGFIQMAVGIAHTITDLNNAVMDPANDAMKKLSYLKSQDFAEFEYMEENYYGPIYVTVIKAVFAKLRDFLENQLSSTNTVWIYLLIAVSCVSPFLLLVGLANINNRFMRLRFIYHVVPAWAVINSFSLRSQMLQTFKLNKNFFQ